MGAQTFIPDRDDAYWPIADPGNGGVIPGSRSGTVGIVTGSGGETNTLEAPLKADLELHLVMRTDGGGDRVVTSVHVLDSSANVAITFADAGDWVQLRSIQLGDAFRWRIVAKDGVALA